MAYLLITSVKSVVEIVWLTLKIDMGRKIIQIAVTGVANNNQTQCNYTTVALCDDGTVWAIRDTDVKQEWVLLPRIPQTEICYSPYSK